jgi:hypothetical protein
VIDPIGIKVRDVETSKRLYQAALALLGYYGAFAIDPDGNNVEAVCHRGA